MRVPSDHYEAQPVSIEFEYIRKRAASTAVSEGGVLPSDWNFGVLAGLQGKPIFVIAVHGLNQVVRVYARKQSQQAKNPEKHLK